MSNLGSSPVALSNCFISHTGGGTFSAKHCFNGSKKKFCLQENGSTGGVELPPESTEAEGLRNTISELNDRIKDLTEKNAELMDMINTINRINMMWNIVIGLLIVSIVLASAAIALAVALILRHKSSSDNSKPGTDGKGQEFPGNPPPIPIPIPQPGVAGKKIGVVVGEKI